MNLTKAKTGRALGFQSSKQTQQAYSSSTQVNVVMRVWGCLRVLDLEGRNSRGRGFQEEPLRDVSPDTKSPS